MKLNINHIYKIIIALLLCSCNKEKVPAYYSFSDKGFGCYGTIVFSFPDIYVYNGDGFEKKLELTNFTEILGYNDEFIFLNEVIIPYKKNKIIVYNLLSDNHYEEEITGIDCLVNGGEFTSYQILESDKVLFINLGCKRNISITLNKDSLKKINIKKQYLADFKKLNSDCSMKIIEKENNISYSKKENMQTIIIGNKKLEVPIQMIPLIDEN